MMSKGKKIYVTRAAGRKLQVKALKYLKEKKAEGKRVEDYYTQADGEQEAPGVWFDPSGIFGLDGGVADGEFTNIFAGRHPHLGSPLGRTVDEDRMGGMEFAFSPPKPFSVLWSAGNSDQRAQIVAIHDRAVERTTLYLQEQAARTRTGAGGQGGMKNAKIIAALFGHRTSREADPQVHTHVAFANIAQRGDGQLKTLEFKEFLKWRGAASAYYRVAICEGLETMGVRVEQDGRNFTLPDVPQALCEDQSTRRTLMKKFHVELRAYVKAKSEGQERPKSEEFGDAIADFAKKWRSLHGSLNWRTMALDDDTTGYADAVALATRAGKPQMTQAELETEWAEQRARHNFHIEQVLGKAPPRERLTAEERAELVCAVIAELTDVSAVVEERNVHQVIAERAQGLLSTAELEVALIEARAHKDLIELAGEPGKRLYSTPEAIEREWAIVGSAKRRSVEQRGRIPLIDDCGSDHRGEVSDAPIVQMMANAWSRPSDTSHVLDYVSEDRFREIIEDLRAKREAAADRAKQDAAEKTEFAFFDLPALPIAPEPAFNRAVVQQVRSLVKSGDPRHVIVTASDADTRAARETWPEATIAQLREGYGLNGHFAAVQAIRRADRVTILEHPSQAERETQHVRSLAARDGRKVELHDSVAFHQRRGEQEQFHDDDAVFGLGS